MKDRQRDVQDKANRIRKELERDLKKIQFEEEFCRNEHVDQESMGGEWKAKDYENGYYLYKKRYDAIKESTAWKITAPLRKTMDCLHAVKNGKRIRKEVSVSQSISKAVVRKTSGKVEVAVHLHLYYEDLMDEFFEYFSHIPETFDLFVSCKEGANIDAIRQAAEKIASINKVVVRECKNRGRDIAPFYVLFRKELQEYEYLLHVHSKKSLYTGTEQQNWRQWALDGVLKDEESVRKSLQYMREGNPRAGLVFGEMTPSLPIMALHWLRNSGRGRELLSRMGMTMDNHMLFYPVGSFFWAKTKAIQPLFDLKLSYKDFDEENGQIDGTLAHALERVVACVVRQRGYAMYIYNPETNEMSVNKSYYPFRKYFTYNAKNIAEQLIKNYDVITFDIFDTLITRVCYQPDDLFRLMERKINLKHGISVDFLKIRKSAEQKAWEENGDFCNIHHIYYMMEKMYDFSPEQIIGFKQMEIDLEYDLCIPRNDVLEIFEQLIKAGKRVILISDMYLTKDIIERMLLKCGYKDYDDIWISCEKGKRKDRDTIWDDFFNKYGNQRTIHVGDNPHSDRQLVGDRKREALLLLSSIEEFRLSRQFDDFEKYEEGTVEDSILLGYYVNKCLYNSPFALTENGVPQITDLEELVKGIFAPLFLEFMDYLQKSSRKESKLLFLAREGLFLEKLYTKYCGEFKKKELPHKYLLTSRRASSVPQIETYDDIKELLKSPYTGKISTLLKERFGLSLRGKDYTIASLATERSKVLSTISDYIEELLILGSEEKENYIEYLKQNVGEPDDLKNSTLVDVGYAASIQYYLMKLLKIQLDGCYMVTEYHIKPEKLSGTVRSLYNFWSDQVFVQTTLFLEAITAAPHGQVKYFVNNQGKYEAVFKPEKRETYEKAAVCQKYIEQYVENVGEILVDINPAFNKELVSCIFGEVMRSGLLSDSIKAFFSVNDEYCNDGNWVYSEELQEWKLV